MDRTTHSHRRRIVWHVAALIGVTLTQPGVSAERNATKFGEIRVRMHEFVSQGTIAGAVTVVGNHDGILSYEAVGLQDIEQQTPMRKDTLFRIASMTKPITAIGIMILVDEGKLSVNDPVERHLPEFQGQMLVASRDSESVVLKKPPRPIQIRDLLTHTSGLPGGPPSGLSDLYVTRRHTLAEAVMAFSQRPLDFEPGSKWAYCNAGIDTLGRIIEVVSRKSYEEFLQQRVFQPLGMTDTTCFPAADKSVRMAVIYDQRDGKLVARENVIVGPGVGATYPIPAGGLYSTAADLAKLYQAMLGRGELAGTRILSESSWQEMTKLQTGDLYSGFTPGMGFGFGWAVVRQPQGVTAMLSEGTFGHGGAFGTQGWIDPKRDLFVILLIQRVGLNNADASPIRQALQEIAFQAEKE